MLILLVRWSFVESRYPLAIFFFFKVAAMAWCFWWFYDYSVIRFMSCATDGCTHASHMLILQAATPHLHFNGHRPRSRHRDWHFLVFLWGADDDDDDDAHPLLAAHSYWIHQQWSLIPPWQRWSEGKSHERTHEMWRLTIPVRLVQWERNS